jgi:hypothetical protein
LPSEPVIHLVIVVALLLSIGCLLLGWRARRRSSLFRRIATLMLAGTGVLSLVVAGTLLWYITRPQPADTQQRLFNGVEYIRDARTTPRPLVIHVVRIDLRSAGLRFLVTPSDPVEGFEMAARTTSAFLEEHGLQLAINGDFFDPWRDYGFWDYYPHTGDGVNVRGLSASDGARYTEGYADDDAFATLFINPDNQPSFARPAEVAQAISGVFMMLQDGAYHVPAPYAAFAERLHPRTAVGVDAAGETLFLLLVDGRQPNYSEGITLPELAALLMEYGAEDALLLDGGGSTTLVSEGDDGQAVVLNSPVHNSIPGRERPIANHLGVFARPVE